MAEKSNRLHSEHVAFRREFRPVDILQFVIFTRLTLVERKHCLHWLGVGVVFSVWFCVVFFLVGFLFAVSGSVLVLSPLQYAVFPILLR